MKFNLTKKEWIQIVLNIVAFVVLIASSGGVGSFWGFLTFNIISGIILLEILLSKDHTAKWLWITKTVTYVFLVIKFTHNMGEFKQEYIYMIAISVAAFLASKHLIKRRSIALWGQNAAYTIGQIMYIQAIHRHPESFGWSHVLFWVIIFSSFAYLVYEVLIHKKAKVNLIIPAYAMVICVVYITFIIYSNVSLHL